MCEFLPDELLDFQYEVRYEEEEEEELDRGEYLDDEKTTSDESETSCEFASDMEDVKRDEIRMMLEYFAKNLFRSKGEDPKANEIGEKCLKLFSRDYHYFEIDNSCGELSTHYPSKIVVLEYEKAPNGPPISRPTEKDSLYQSLYDVNRLKDLFQRARLARCRARFPIPVILVDGKHICRSATLSGGPEIYGRSSYDFFFAGKTGGFREEDFEEDEETDLPVLQTSSDWQLFDRVRSQDIRLLKLLSVSSIVDLMVEKKKIKFGMKITSSEKVDKENRYSDFTILSLPYPGCEFFREFSANGYNARGLVFSWNQPYVDARLIVPNDNVASKLDVDWQSYKMWDVVKLTQNYLKLLLKYVSNGTGGVLIHCISGWDRTPLFVSLLRLSLWADGKIHQSLKPLEILYLTLAYDWFLFGHNLPDRLGKGEEILFFCFDFLKYITSEEFSLRQRRSKARSSETENDDVQLDGVNVRGSNTSLNSSCSSVSTRSQDCPLFFTTGSYESSDEMCGSAVPQTCHTDGASHGRTSMQPPSQISGPEVSMVSPSLGFRSSTTPVAVPSNLARWADGASSIGCGSWQIISGAGSFRGSTTTRDSSSSSSQTLGSDHSVRSRRNRGSLTLSESSADCDPILAASTAAAAAAHHPPLPHPHHHHHLMRPQRLHAVRNAFHNLYVSAVGFRFRNGGSGDSSGLSSLLDHFAEKVGIRAGRPT